MSKDFLIIGDSNVCRYYTRLGLQAQNLNVVGARNYSEVVQALQTAFSNAYKFIVLACITNLLVAAGETGSTDSQRLSSIEEMLNNLLPLLRDVIAANVGPDYFLAAPTTRLHPSWYLHLLPSISSLLSRCLQNIKPNLSTLKAFPTTKDVLDSDGFHFTVLSGVEYVLHLIDQPRVLKTARTCKNAASRFSFLADEINAMSTVQAAHTALLELHSNKHLISEAKFAEETCGRINTENLHHLMILGGPVFTGDDIQTQLKQQVAKYLAPLGDFMGSVVHIRQFKSKRSDAGTYDVEMTDKAVSGRVREAFGAFFRGKKANKPAIPAVLNKISLNISHTLATRVRVRMMKQMAKLHGAANPDLSVFVTNYHARPLFKIRHPNNRADSYSFVDAVTRFGSHLKRDFLAAESLYARNGGIPASNLQSIFLLLNQDFVIPSSTPASTRQVSLAAELISVKRTAAEAFTEVDATNKKKKGKGKGKGKVTNPSTSKAPLTTTNRFDALGTPLALDKSFQPERMEDEDGSDEEEDEEGTDVNDVTAQVTVETEKSTTE